MAQVISDGILSDNFEITNNTRKGCPLSPIIFTLLMEHLAQKINHPYISGVKIVDKKHKITLYADNIILTITDAASSLHSLYDVLLKFSHISYYKGQQNQI